VIQSFANKGAEDVFDGVDSKAARAMCPRSLHKIARRKLEQLNAAASLDDMRAPPGNMLEKLRGDRAGQHSVRVNQQYRVCFMWTAQGAVDVEIVDYH
jgi:toxin HigB-1